MFSLLYYTQWTFLLVYRVIDLFTTVTNATNLPPKHDHDQEEYGRTNWISESLPFLIMVTITWISFRWKISYPRRARDCQHLFVEHNHESNKGQGGLATETAYRDDFCPICLEKYHEVSQNGIYQRIVRTKRCGHIFHEECFVQWCDHQASSVSTKVSRNLFLSCPCCRSKLDIVENDKMDTLQNNGTIGPLYRSIMMQRWQNDVNTHRQWQTTAFTRRRYHEEMASAALGMGILAEAMVLVIRLRRGEKFCLA